MSLKKLTLAIGFIICVTANASSARSDSIVEILRTPNGGGQPRATVDEEGTVHLVYYKSMGSAGNLFYVTKKHDASEWSEPIRINSTDKNVVRNGSLSLAQIALGDEGRVHVTWFDMRAEKYWYARSNDEANAFEPQRSLVKKNHRGVEAGAAITANSDGSVYLIWHAGDFGNESRRGLYMRKSEDAGKTFGTETRINTNGKGVCGCCALSAVLDNENIIYVSYRTAGDGVHRDMTLLKSEDGGQNFSEEIIDTWELGSCPVTITRLQAKPQKGAIVAFESREQAFFADVADLTNKISVGLPPSIGRQKNPALAASDDGTTIIAWAEGKSWNMGGRLHWQVFDSTGKPTDEKGQGIVDMPRSTIPEAVATSNGRYLVIY